MHRRSFLLTPVALALAAKPARAVSGAGPLKVSGSSMALAAMRRVGAAFTAAGGPPVEVLQSLGTSGGLKALGAGVIDLSVASRPSTSAEVATGIITAHFASTALAFMTRQAEPARSITREQLEQIFTGDLANWPEGTPVRFVRRQPSDSDWEIFESLSPGLARAVAVARTRPGVPTFINDQDHAAALERLPGAFGSLSLGQVAAEERRLRAVAIDGVLPTAAALESGAWPLVKHLFVAHGASPRPEALALVAFLCGPEAATLLTALDHIPPSNSRPGRLPGARNLSLPQPRW